MCVCACPATEQGGCCSNTQSGGHSMPHLKYLELTAPQAASQQASTPHQKPCPSKNQPIKLHALRSHGACCTYTQTHSAVTGAAAPTATATAASQPRSREACSVCEHRSATPTPCYAPVCRCVCATALRQGGASPGGCVMARGLMPTTQKAAICTPVL